VIVSQEPHEQLNMQKDQWLFSKDHNQVCRVIETQTLWGVGISLVYIPGLDLITRIPGDRLEPLERHAAISKHGIIEKAAVAKISEALSQNTLLAPITSSVIPLPHQVRALTRALSQDRVRYLLADEVGLGKTIEAGLIMRELKLRGMAERTLIIAPKSLATQWVGEMRLHFNEDFKLVTPDEIQRFSKFLGASADFLRDTKGEVTIANPWRMFSQIVVPMDSVKPLEKRHGWSAQQIQEYNSQRFEDLISAGWDLVVVDEAHRLGGSSEQVARYKLGKGLATAAPYFLLLTATPHQGKTDSFHRLITLLEPKAFPDIGSVTKEKIRLYVIRTEKRKAINADGKPLFKPRKTMLVPVEWSLDRHHEQKRLYDAVTDYVREGYNQAMLEKRSYIGFLMILMQRMMVSSTRAIRQTLERRLAVVEDTAERRIEKDPEQIEAEWNDMDAQEQVERLLNTQIRALAIEKSHIELLLETAARCESIGPDAKAEALIDRLYCLQQEEKESDLKVLIFTEFTGTQDMLAEFLTELGFSVVCLNGSMSMKERQDIQTAFAKKARILVSTDAGGEGLNLQFCHVVINYDLPWNPMRVEQRIGRVDRIGQPKIVKAVNFVLQGSVEMRVQEVLEEKLAVILEEFGVDKTGDVLDSAQAGQIFDDIYVKAIIDPQSLDQSVENLVTEIRNQSAIQKESFATLAETEELDPKAARNLLNHPLPYWVELMTVNHALDSGGKANKRSGFWRLTWSKDVSVTDAVFNARDAEKNPAATYLTLEEPQIRELIRNPGAFAEGQPIPICKLRDLPGDISGIWSAWLIALDNGKITQRRVASIFEHFDGRILIPTAKRILDELVAESFEIDGYMDATESAVQAKRAFGLAIDAGKACYEDLLREHETNLAREDQIAMQSFDARRKIIERIGLAPVRNFRLNQLKLEESDWRDSREKRSLPLPNIKPLLMLRVI
jgi:superfamily II DNA or RNA helicase